MGIWYFGIRGLKGFELENLSRRSEELKKKDHKSFHDYSKYKHVRPQFSKWQNEEKITSNSSSRDQDQVIKTSNSSSKDQDQVSKIGLLLKHKYIK
ncbi:hypothetical protein Tco_1115225 [Tanacetum coccineum]